MHCRIISQGISHKMRLPGKSPVLLTCVVLCILFTLALPVDAAQRNAGFVGSPEIPDQDSEPGQDYKPQILKVAGMRHKRDACLLFGFCPENGAPGPSGSQGERGFTGFPGPMGPRGYNGERGYPGQSGAKGEKGVGGDRGWPGERGPNGYDGGVGPKGSQGLPGTQGNAGPPGTAGNPGLPGPDGRDGQMGIKGEVGLPGLSGPPGLPGSPGDSGPQGMIGLNGAKGDRGEMGIQGNSGLPGMPGIDGKSCESCGLPGTKGEVGEPGRPGNLGPIGLPGTAGSKGPKGETGAQGPHGIQGLTGDRGLPGHPGVAGERGLPGLRGETGPAGVDGALGPRGPEGPTGINGEKGVKGELGEKGIKGNRGLTGQPGLSSVGPPGPIGPPGPPGNCGCEAASLNALSAKGKSEEVDVDNMLSDDTLLVDNGISAEHRTADQQMLKVHFDRFMKPNGQKSSPAKTCHDLAVDHPTMPSGEYWIDPNEGNARDAILVYCDMATHASCVWPMPGRSGHIQYNEAKRKVWLGDIHGGFEVSYKADSNQLGFLQILSGHAEQNVTYHCRASGEYYHNEKSTNIYSLKLLGWNDAEITEKGSHRLRYNALEDGCNALSESWSKTVLLYTSNRATRLPFIDMSIVSNVEHELWLEIGPVCFF